MFSQSFSYSSTTIRLTTVTIAIAIILAASNFTSGVAQQQNQLATNQAPVLQNSPSATATPAATTSSAMSTEDSFKVQVPSGWIIQDVNNRGFTLASEVLQGYGLLAQLCPAEQEVQQQQTPQGEPNSGVDSNMSSNSDGSCQGVQKEVIHILRYPNLAAWIGVSPDDITRNDDAAAGIILAYQMQKLQEAGYRDIRIVNRTDTTINVDIGTGLNNNTTTARLPAKLTELTYTTNLAPDETKRGYFVSTATNVTPRNLGLITGYGIFYEGLDATIRAEGENQTTMQRSSLLLQPLTPIKQVIDSFELIAGPEIVQAIIAAQTQQVTQQEEIEDTLAVEIDSSDTEGATPARFEFEADITGGTEPFTIMWDVDDDQIAESNEETLVATFRQAGTYNIDLVVADVTGQIASDSVEVTIEEGEEEPSDERPSTVQEEEQLTEEMPEEEETTCDPSYPNICIPPPPPILSCDDVEASNFEVRPPDLHHFDADNDGVGCENENNEQVDLDGEPNRLGINGSRGIDDIIDHAIRGFFSSSST
jgi:PKD repeat protein